MKRMFTVSFWQDQGVCIEEVPHIYCCVIPVLAWVWVKGPLSSDCIYSVVDDLDVYLPFSVCFGFKSPFLSLHLFPGLPLSCIHTEPVLHRLPCVEAKQCGLSTPGVSGSVGLFWERTSLWPSTCYSASHWNLKTTNCSVILLVMCSLYFL